MTRYTTEATLITNGDHRRGVDYRRCGCLVSEGAHDGNHRTRPDLG
jgi:hypothetical protein